MKKSKPEEPLVTYPTGSVMLQEGWYSQADIENILQGMKQANEAVLRSMEKIPKEKKK